MKRIAHIFPLFLGTFLFFTTSKAQVSVGLSITVAPPAIPTYVQPACPVDGYLWTPGYWAYGPNGYYWVPGVWIAPPQPGYLWTPGYWGFAGGIYGWHPGYWGAHVGYYGGINYGFGYGGVGFVGGMWQGGAFHYNTAVVNVNRTVVRNVYVNKTVINNTTIINNRSSFNGPGGVNARPTREEQTYANERHISATNVQTQHQNVARNNKAQYFSNNNGTPHNLAMDRANGNRFNNKGEQVQRANAPARQAGAPQQAQRTQQAQRAQPQRVQNERPARTAPTAQQQQRRPEARSAPQARPQAEHHEEGGGRR